MSSGAVSPPVRLVVHAKVAFNPFPRLTMTGRQKSFRPWKTRAASSDGGRFRFAHGDF
jgi:hypothetical protein